MATQFATRRLGKELQKAKAKLPPGISIAKADDFREWQMDIQVLDDNPIYQNGIYRLSFIFGSQYPIEAPEVSFIPVAASTTTTNNTSAPPNSATNPVDLTTPTTKPPPDTGLRTIPMHPHIYSNGIICLDLLGSAGWSPVQSVESVCVSIQSMLTGNTKNERPQGDEAFCRSMGVRGVNGWSGGGGGSGGGGRGGRGVWGQGGRGLRDVRFAYDDDTV